MLSGSIDPLDLDFEVLIREEFSPAARSAAIAAVAREQLAEAQAVNVAALSFVPAHSTLVDGQAGAAEDQVRPDGVIVYTFQLLPEIFGWIVEQLRAHAPVLTGRFRDSFEFYADGALADPSGEIPAASEYVFLSPLAYARKLEEGSSRQAPDGVFQAVATLAAQRFGNQALIRFVYRAPIDGALLTGRAGGRSDLRVPAISIQLRG
ncbi:hypothetical protein [Bradyrhizobium sp. RD5-C2]|uniref:hypothetical protein n=1 Tax=Bradyrhizobium sp. RD5-C2 TaxID=244562 RepID=UPI001CC68581|nr:hypothetical protein [Bradyrhizobium sp. RD5-C2]GIQ73191.1 hypothetical protein BraRD5C2_16290 [Bradyrhizobium sp. RD5-C2]